jgi:hypothetical protein
MSKQFLRMYRADEVSEEAGTPIRYTIATEGIKRDGLNLRVSGARVDNYLRNPIVTWVHDFMGHRLPIGRATLIMDQDRIDAEITFDQQDEFACQVESKYRRGYLHAVSVSWNPLRMNGRDVEEWEFLELAAVPVPGDPEALIKRQYEALKRFVEDDAGSEQAAQGEWDDLAAKMVAVFLPSPDDGSGDPPHEGGTSRERRYRALLPKYRKAGKVAPEFLSDEDLKGLDSRTLANHFLEGEWGLVFPEGERKGAVLSTRNLDDLSRAVALLQGVLERAKKEDEPDIVDDTQNGSSNPEDEPERSDERAEAALNEILVNLRKLEV